MKPYVLTGSCVSSAGNITAFLSVAVLSTTSGQLHANISTESTQSVQVVDIRDIHFLPNEKEITQYNQIKRLESIKPGWCDGLGDAPTKSAMSSVKTAFDILGYHELDAVAFPVEDGGVDLQVPTQHGTVIIEIESNGCVRDASLAIAGEVLHAPLFERNVNEAIAWFKDLEPGSG